jgi:hypothetical protein
MFRVPCSAFRVLGSAFRVLLYDSWFLQVKPSLSFLLMLIYIKNKCIATNSEGFTNRLQGLSWFFILCSLLLAPGSWLSYK